METKTIEAIPNIIFIEWYYTPFLSDKKVETICWAKMPQPVYDVLTGVNTAIVIQLEDKMFDGLYADSPKGFEELSANMKSMAVELLTCKKHQKTIFIFGTKRVVNRVSKAITNHAIMPLVCFNVIHYNAYFPLAGDAYALSQAEQGKMLLLKMARFIPAPQVTAHQPRLS